MTDIEAFQQELELFNDWDQREKSPAKVPTRDVVTSVFGLGPIPLTQIINTITMVDESNRLKPNRTELAPAEKVTRSPRIARAKRRLEQVCKGPAEVLINDIKNVMAGYVVVKAESHEAAAKLFENHAHFTHFPGDSVEIMEVLPMPTAR